VTRKGVRARAATCDACTDATRARWQSTTNAPHSARTRQQQPRTLRMLAFSRMNLPSCVNAWRVWMAGGARVGAPGLRGRQHHHALASGRCDARTPRGYAHTQQAHVCRVPPQTRGSRQQRVASRTAPRCGTTIRNTRTHTHAHARTRTHALRGGLCWRARTHLVLLALLKRHLILPAQVGVAHVAENVCHLRGVLRARQQQRVSGTRTRTCVSGGRASDARARPGRCRGTHAPCAAQ
jgi:hypothetical protein